VGDIHQLLLVFLQNIRGRLPSGIFAAIGIFGETAGCLWRHQQGLRFQVGVQKPCLFLPRRKPIHLWKVDRSSWYSHTFIKRFNGWQPGCHLWPPLVPIFLQAKLDMYGVDWGKEETVDLHRNYLLYYLCPYYNWQTNQIKSCARKNLTLFSCSQK